MKTHIKICGFTEPVGLEAAIAAGVDSVGLVLDPSPRQLSIAEAVRLRAYIPDTVQLVAVCGRPDLDTHGHPPRAEAGLHPADGRRPAGRRHSHLRLGGSRDGFGTIARVRRKPAHWC